MILYIHFFKGLFYYVSSLIWYIFLQENLQHWLTDKKARDQLVIRAGPVTEVLWNDARQLKADPVYKCDVCRFIYLNLIFNSGEYDFIQVQSVFHQINVFPVGDLAACYISIILLKP